MSLLQGGDLSAAMSDDKSGSLKWYSKGQHIAMDVVRGLAYLHKCKVVQHPRMAIIIMCQPHALKNPFNVSARVKFRGLCLHQ